MRLPVTPATTLWRELRDRVRRRYPAGRVVVAVDGLDGAGKTVFADELAAELAARGREVVRVSADDWHQVRALRHARGRTSAEGFWLDSYDYPRLRAEVLDPLGSGGSREYRARGHDPLLRRPAALRRRRRASVRGAG